MGTRILLVTALLSTIPSVTIACSCFGPESFCETLDPPFPNPEWWVPDAVVLGVKLGDYQHGMDVKILQSFAGALSPDDTVRVWGDCGFLCRHYPGTWNVGDTVVWGFRLTDLAGNSLCGTNYEQPGEYMISICGVYYLDYTAGVVTGPITSDIMESMPIEQFGQLVDNCLTTGVNEESVADVLVVRYDDGVPVIEARGVSRLAELSVIDAQGRSVLSRSWDGRSMRIEGCAPGAYVVQVWIDGSRTARQSILQEK